MMPPWGLYDDENDNGEELMMVTIMMLMMKMVTMMTMMMITMNIENVFDNDLE